MLVPPENPIPAGDLALDSSLAMIPVVPIQVRGPTHIHDKEAVDENGNPNPMITDAVYVNFTAQTTNPYKINFTSLSQKYYQANWGGHYYKGLLFGINECYPDSHVERRRPDEVQARFKSNNAWNCR